MISPPLTHVLEWSSRQRRSAGLWPLAWIAATVLTTAPLAVAATPLAYLAAALAVRAAGLAGLATEPVLLTLRAARPESLSAPAIVALVLPGLAAGLALWLRVRSLLGDGGTAAILALLGAREARPDDAAEQRLADRVAAAADSAALAPPAVRVLDRTDVNLAAVGRSPADAVLVVTRGALDRLEASELRALAIQRLAAIAAGDPTLTRAALAVHATFGVLLTAGDALFAWSPAAWRRLAVLAPRRGDRDARERSATALLASDPAAPAGVGLFLIAEGEPTACRRVLDRRPWLWAVGLLFSPLLVLWLLYRSFLRLVHGLLVDPMIALVLRGRCHRADLFAAELLGDSSALASALGRVAGEAAVLSLDGRLDPLFVSAPKRAAGSGAWSGRSGELAPHPPLDRRLARLSGSPPAGFLEPGASPLLALAHLNVRLAGVLLLTTLIAFLYGVA